MEHLQATMDLRRLGGPPWGLTGNIKKKKSKPTQLRVFLWESKIEFVSSSLTTGFFLMSLSGKSAVDVVRLGGRRWYNGHVAAPSSLFLFYRGVVFDTTRQRSVN